MLGIAGKEAELYSSLSDRRVRCTACARLCEMRPGQRGLCGIRGNEDGRLYLYVYGRVISGHVDPIEKKPLVHYRPASRIYSIATTGCNWLCRYCQNSDISQRRKVEGQRMTPDQVADAAVRLGSHGIAYTYNEPSIFIEFARDCGLAARDRGLFNIFVTNGYDTPESVRMMGQFLDGITVDFKGNAEKEFARRFIGVPDPQPIFDTLREIRDKTDIHVEITDLVVPGVGDDLGHARRLAKFIYDEFGPDVPIHFLRFHPDYNMMECPSTPVRTLERHHEVARQEGLRYVYLGNVPGHKLEHTYCHGCGEIAVRRHGFGILGWYLDGQNRCSFCGCPVPILGRPPDKWKPDRFVFV